jgi:peptide deformylase
MSDSPTLPTKIVSYPDPVLREKCAPVETFDEELRRLAGRMLELMKANRGVGLAGPQVGARRRIFVCNATGEPGDDRVYINPELSDLVGPVEAEEGCLSIPEVRVQIRRAGRCRLKAYDLDGKPVEAEASELLARIWQHEVDHLDGRLIIDSMTPADRIANKKQLAQLEADYRAINKAGKSRRSKAR